MVTIYINLASLILHASFQDHWKKKIVKVLSIYGYGGHLGHVTETIFIYSRPSFPRKLCMKFGFNMQRAWG